MDRRDFFKKTAGAVVVATFGLKLKADQTTIQGWHPDIIIMDDLIETGDVYHVPRTGESIFVKSQEAGEWQLIRGFGNTKAYPVKEDDPVWILGSAEELKEPVKVDTVVDKIEWKEELKPRVIEAAHLFGKKKGGL
jgi:hypothetical protein